MSDSRKDYGSVSMSTSLLLKKHLASDPTDTKSTTLTSLPADILLHINNFNDPKDKKAFASASYSLRTALKEPIPTRQAGCCTSNGGCTTCKRIAYPFLKLNQKLYEKFLSPCCNNENGDCSCSECLVGTICTIPVLAFSTVTCTLGRFLGGCGCLYTCCCNKRNNIREIKSQPQKELEEAPTRQIMR